LKIEIVDTPIDRFEFISKTIQGNLFIARIPGTARRTAAGVTRRLQLDLDRRSQLDLLRFMASIR
jgi:hypothetical protein